MSTTPATDHAILAGLPRVQLLDGPTPLERLERIEASSGHRAVYVKRDDCMALGLGGNKVRSLEFWLGAALDQGCDIVLAAGLPVSNQCRLVAAAAAKLGLDCLILHNAEAPGTPTGNLLLSRIFGAEIRFLGPVSEAARDKALDEAAAELRRSGRRPYIVGDAVTGALGYVAGALELARQARDRGLGLRHVLLPGSMGTTEAGFLFGCALAGRPFTVHLVSVEYPLEELKTRLERILAGLAARLETEAAKDWRDWTRLHDRYLGAGYQIPTEESVVALATFARREGLLLENTYVAKTFAGLLDLIARGEIPVDEPVCALHTGGLPALFGQAELMTEILAPPVVGEGG